jgi:hypothetical protein
MRDIAFDVVKAPDQSILNAVQTAIKSSSFLVRQIRFHFLIGSGEVSVSGDAPLPPEIERIFSLGGELLSQFEFSLRTPDPDSQNFMVRVHRQQKQAHDTVNLELSPINDSKKVEVTLFVARLRKELRATDSAETIRERIGKEVLTNYEVREAELKKLENIAISLVSDQEKHRKNLELQYDGRRVELEKEFQTKFADLNSRQESLKVLQAQLDDRAAKHARRDIGKGFKDELKSRSLKFDLTPGTQSMRAPIFWFVLLLLCLSGIPLFYSLYDFMIHPEIVPATAAIVRQGFLALTFASTAFFYIRWSNNWFERHAREEFELKRLGLDFDRASWAAELSSEWQDERKRALPDELLERVTQNLFSGRRESEEPLHPLEYLDAAILGASAELEFQGPNGMKLRLDRKGLKALQKVMNSERPE